MHKNQKKQKNTYKSGKNQKYQDKNNKIHQVAMSADITTIHITCAIHDLSFR
jgi:hypothetical protein